MQAIVEEGKNNNNKKISSIGLGSMPAANETIERQMNWRRYLFYMHMGDLTDMKSKSPKTG